MKEKPKFRLGEPSRRAVMIAAWKVPFIAAIISLLLVGVIFLVGFALSFRMEMRERIRIENQKSALVAVDHKRGDFVLYSKGVSNSVF